MKACNKGTKNGERLLKVLNICTKFEFLSTLA